MKRAREGEVTYLDCEIIARVEHGEVEVLAEIRDHPSRIATTDSPDVIKH